MLKSIFENYLSNGVVYLKFTSRTLIGTRTRVNSSPRLLIKGIPYNTSKQDILDFFRGFDIDLDTSQPIDYITDSNSKFIGHAYVYCNNLEALYAAIKHKNKCTINGKRISLFIDSGDDVFRGFNIPLLTKLDRARFPKDNR